MDTSMLRTPLIAQTVEALVEDGGGLITYEQGMGGRETLVAAAAALAARNGSPLIIVESPLLHQDTRATVAELQPGVQCTVISAQDAALQPTPAPGSVLAVHADMLRDPTVREPLLKLARATDHLLVARHDYSDPTLDTLAGPTHRLDYPAFTSAANKDFTSWAEPFTSTYVPLPIEQREGRTARQEAAVDDLIGFTEFVERKQRLNKQLNQRTTDRPPPDNDEYIDLVDVEAGSPTDLDGLATAIEASPPAELDWLAAEEERITAFVARL
ncbi:hypothetical protein [Streptomyces sp. NPDC058861]|uniref:hypothetical protein n=1 Tax=Streptomyces sp. NPDC058861 TaxID=3346653 RepID=UPI0036C3AFFE